MGTFEMRWKSIPKPASAAIRKEGRYLPLVGLVALALTVTPATAMAGPRPALQCGDTISRNTVLHADLRDCPGEGLVIGADGVTLELNGHTISGTVDNSSVGIQATAHSGLSVRNGTIRGFSIGVLLVTVTESQVTHLHVVDAQNIGIVLRMSSSAVVSGNRVTHSGESDASGIRLFQTSHTLVVGNVLTHNGEGIFLRQSDHNTIVLNRSSHERSGVGLFEHSTFNTVASNIVNDNTDTGVLLDEQADDNRVIDNVARRNAFAGIAVGNSSRNLVRGNITRANLGAGIAVTDNSEYTRVVGNSANGNGAKPPGCVPDCPFLDDGIFVNAPLTYLVDNGANHNADLGIDAVANVIGGDGNTARHNGDPRQCTGVICLPQ
jgi:parallel beta-helix repeat protein